MSLGMLYAKFAFDENVQENQLYKSSRALSESEEMGLIYTQGKNSVTVRIFSIKNNLHTYSVVLTQGETKKDWNLKFTTIAYTGNGVDETDFIYYVLNFDCENGVVVNCEEKAFMHRFNKITEEITQDTEILRSPITSLDELNVNDDYIGYYAISIAVNTKTNKKHVYSNYQALITLGAKEFENEDDELAVINEVLSGTKDDILDPAVRFEGREYLNSDFWEKTAQHLENKFS